MKVHLLCLAFLVAGVLGACGTGDKGNAMLTPAAVSAIRKGETTKDQVRSLLGAPQSSTTRVPIPRPPGTQPLPAKYAAAEIWAFWATHREHSWLHLPFIASAAAAKQSTYSATVYFDPQGVVIDCQTEETYR